MQLSEQLPVLVCFATRGESTSSGQQPAVPEVTGYGDTRLSCPAASTIKG
jgi:hypothetical protein